MTGRDVRYFLAGQGHGSIRVDEACAAVPAGSDWTEALVWGRLRDRLAGLKFRRQHPREGCVADFYFAEKALVVEVDGGVHLTAKQRERDELRDQELRERGILVIRFKNEEVDQDLQAG